MAKLQLRALFLGLLLLVLSPLSFAELIELPPDGFSLTIAKESKADGVQNATVTLTNLSTDPLVGPLEVEVLSIAKEHCKKSDKKSSKGKKSKKSKKSDKKSDKKSNKKQSSKHSKKSSKSNF
jgi:hypothetical protein